MIIPIEQGKHQPALAKRHVPANHDRHGEAMLEKRGREFHIYAQAVWPEYFMNVLQPHAGKTHHR